MEEPTLDRRLIDPRHVPEVQRADIDEANDRLPGQQGSGTVGERRLAPPCHDRSECSRGQAAKEEVA